MWIVVGLVLFAVLLFFLIARKGRELRTRRPLPPESYKAYLESAHGKKHLLETKTHFYLGRSFDSDIVLAGARQEFELCIFYHRKRFAFQALSGREVLVNGEEQIAGYLSDGDVLQVAGEAFTFHSMPAKAGGT
jgi:hypothetical protein